MKRFFSKIWGYIIFGIAKFFDVILGGLNKGVSFLVNITKRIRNVLAPITIGVLFFSPFLFRLIPIWLWIPLLIIFIFPFLGSGFVSFLEYWKYVLCEFLYDKSEDLIKGTSKGQIFGSYGDKYKKQKAAEEEAERRRKYAEEAAAREKRRQQQQEQWARIFEQFFGGFTGGTGSYGPFSGYGTGTGSYGQGQGRYYNPAADFNQQYRKHCDVLEIPYDTDEYQVKLAYRKKAKQYHPDINKAANATQKFQEVSSAYEFLSQENIDRYKRLNNM
ncbi:MAG TPA: DnaJ domain-containing protein [Clostridiaceae bacterium]|nr:DnaJ domain-containing protein [Clostridiaceae bacterium]